MKKMVIVWVGGTIILAIVQWLSPYIWGADGYLHAQMAKMIWEKKGFLQELPQLPYSFFATKFSDKDFLYHLLLVIPVRVLGLMQGAKVGAFLGAVFLWSVFLYVLDKMAPRYFVFGSAAFFLAPLYLVTVSRPRPMVMSFGLMLMSLYFVSSRKVKALFVAALLYTMFHITGPIVVAFALLWSVVRYIKKKAFDVGVITAAIAGVAVGFLIHPNFPNNLFYFYLNGILVPWYATRWGVLELGAEFFPLPIIQYVVSYPIMVGGGMLLIIGAMRWRKLGSKELFFAIAGVGFLFLSFKSRRYGAQAYPLVVIGALMVVDKFKGIAGAVDRVMKSEVMTVVVLGVLMYVSYGFFVVKQYGAFNSVTGGHFVEASKVIGENFPPGSQVFHANWSDPQYLLGLAPSYQYLVALDPVYMYRWNEEKYKIYREIARVEVDEAVYAIKGEFGADLVYTDKVVFRRFYDKMKSESEARLVWEDDMGAVFDVR